MPRGRKPNPIASVTDRGPEDTQVLTFITPALSAEDKQRLESKVHTALVNSIAARAKLDTSLAEYAELYEGIVPEGKSFPWDNSANINVPITQEMLDGLHARLSKSTLGVSPLVLVKADDSVAADVQFRLERYYDSLSERLDIAEVIGQGVFLALRDGLGIIKVTWERRTRKIKTRQLQPLTGEDGQPIIDPDSPDGRPLTQENVIAQDVVEYDDVKLIPVELKDFYVFPAHAYDINRMYAKGVAERIWIRWDELKKRGASGMYWPEAVENIKAASVSSRATQFGSTSATLGVDTIQGEISLINLEPEDFREYELFEIVMSEDLDGDGYEEECLLTYNARFHTLLRAEIFPYWHQLRPYITFIPWPRPRRLYGFSVPQRLEPTQREINAIHNQRLDAVSLRLSPPIVITRNAILRGDSSQPWGPGARFEVNNPNDIVPMNLPDINPSSFSEESILRQYAERIIGLYDINTPRGTGSRRTGAEIGAIQQESLVRFDYMIKLLQRSIVKVFEQIHHLKIQYMPPEEEFEAQTSQGRMSFKISRPEMLTNFRFVANGDLPVADKEQNRQEAVFLYQALMQNPLVAQNPQRLFAITKDLLEAFEKKDIDKIIGSEEQMMMQAQAGAQAGPMQAGAASAAEGMMPGGGMTGGEQARPVGPAGATRVAGTIRRPAGGPATAT